MKKLLMTLALAGGAMFGMQAVSATPAAAFGSCGWGGCCGAVHYRSCGSCCGCRHYRVVRYYRVVRRHHHCCR